MNPFIKQEDIDDIFKDNGPTLGADPFALNEGTLKPEAIGHEQPGDTIAAELSFPLQLMALMNAHDLSYRQFLQELLHIVAEQCGGRSAVFLEHNLRTQEFTTRAEIRDAVEYPEKTTISVLIRGVPFGVIELRREKSFEPIAGELAAMIAQVIENRLLLAQLTRADEAVEEIEDFSQAA